MNIPVNYCQKCMSGFQSNIRFSCVCNCSLKRKTLVACQTYFTSSVCPAKERCWEEETNRLNCQWSSFHQLWACYVTVGHLLKAEHGCAWTHLLCIQMGASAGHHTHIDTDESGVYGAVKLACLFLRMICSGDQPVRLGVQHCRSAISYK